MNRNLQPVITELHKAFNKLNEAFYKGKLPEVIIAIQAKGKSNAYGWFTPAKIWSDGTEEKHEITITAEHLNRNYIEILQTLHHEMIHLYCETEGIKDTSRGSTYHNKRFKAECEARGFYYEIDTPDSRIGWSEAKLKPETIELINTWNLNTDVFGIARKDFYGVGTGKRGKKKSNIVKWECPKCGDVVRSSKPVVFAKCCKPVIEEDGSFNGEFCDSFFVREDGVTVEQLIKEMTNPEQSEEPEAEKESIAEVATKPIVEFEYENGERRYNAKTCPGCPFFTGTHCRRHVSNVERKKTITKTFEVRPLDFENPYKKKNECDLLGQHINTYYRLEEDR
jgi:hypothetical protein